MYDIHPGLGIHLECSSGRSISDVQAGCPGGIPMRDLRLTRNVRFDAEFPGNISTGKPVSTRQLAISRCSRVSMRILGVHAGARCTDLYSTLSCRLLHALLGRTYILFPGVFARSARKNPSGRSSLKQQLHMMPRYRGIGYVFQRQRL